MRLASAGAGEVVRNVNNGSHYRFERVEKSRARIRPLELFPTGRLVAKPTDTLVSPDILVILIGPWQPGMRAEGSPARTLAQYELELAEQRVRLVALDAEYLTLPQDGIGKLSRGSFANKVKNCRARIATLREGLGLDGSTADRVVAPRVEPAASVGFAPRDLVQVPSGRAGLVLSNSGGVATVRTSFDGSFLQADLDVACLRPWAEARLATA